MLLPALAPLAGALALVGALPSSRAADAPTLLARIHLGTSADSGSAAPVPPQRRPPPAPVTLDPLRPRPGGHMNPAPRTYGDHHDGRRRHHKRADGEHVGLTGGGGGMRLIVRQPQPVGTSDSEPGVPGCPSRTGPLTRAAVRQLAGPRADRVTTGGTRAGVRQGASTGSKTPVRGVVSAPRPTSPRLTSLLKSPSSRPSSPGVPPIKPSSHKPTSKKPSPNKPKPNRPTKPGTPGKPSPNKPSSFKPGSRPALKSSSSKPSGSKGGH